MGEIQYKKHGCHFEGGTTEKSPEREPMLHGDFSLWSK